jgi:hypothetical protein
MEAVMARERALRHTPVHVSAQKIGYDIAPHDPKSGHLRPITARTDAQRPQLYRVCTRIWE